MQKKKSIGVNFIMNTVVQGSAYILPFIATPYVSRILLPEGMGKVSYATSIITYFVMFALLGVPTYGVRECARVSQDKEILSRVVKEIVTVNFTMGFMVYVVLFGFLKSPIKSSVDKDLLLLMSPAILLNVMNIDWLYKGIEEFSVIAVRNVIVRIVCIAAIFVMVKTQNDYKLYGLLTILASYGVGIWNFWGGRKYVDIHIKGKMQIKRHLIPIAIFFGMTVATTIYTNLDTVMLGIMCGDAETGIYDSAVKIRSILVSAVSALGIVLLPRITSYIRENDYESFKRVSGHALNIVMIMSLSFVVFAEVNAENIIMLFSGSEFYGAVDVLRCIIPTVFLIGITNIVGIQMLLPLGKEKWVFASEIVGAVVDLVFNLILIPVMGAVGAAIGTLLAEVAVTLIQIYACKQYIFQIINKIQYWKILIAMIIPCCFIMLVKLLSISYVWEVIISACIFYFFMIANLVLLHEKEMVFLMRKIIKREDN